MPTKPSPSETDQAVAARSWNDTRRVTTSAGSAMAVPVSSRVSGISRSGLVLAVLGSQCTGTTVQVRVRLYVT